jgi:hypothetical protein
MACLQERCFDCGAAVTVRVGQVADRGRLRWWASRSCPECGKALELDGGGDIPEEARRAILEEQGTWALTVSEEGTNVIRVMKVLREALALPLAEVRLLRQRIPDEVITGTAAEVERLRRLLAEEGVSANIEKLT